MNEDLCSICRHDFFDRHMETDRHLPTAAEKRRRKCNDCLDCNPPEDAPVRERDREVVPA